MQLQVHKYYEEIHCSYSGLLDISKYASVSERHTVETTQDIPYNTVSIHIPIIDILAMGGSAVLLAAILSQLLGRI